MELEMGHPPAAATGDGQSATPRRRWLAALGLGDEADEKKKKK